MSSNAPNARGLEGKASNGDDEEDSKIKPREFFWDSITLYVVFAIVSLSSIDLIIEFIRQPEVRCFSRNNQTELADYQDYVNEFCYGTSALSNINIFRICSYILGFGIAALHYLWLNHYGGRFAFFFQLVSDIKRQRSEETGDYPKDNQIIADQLEDSFTTFKQNSIFWVYLAKLFLQLLLSVAGVVGIGYYFTQLRFDTSFYCPETFEATSDEDGPWPLIGVRVTCVYTSFPLLELICIADMALLALAIVLLSASIVWCSASHSKQLGYKDVAVFVFQTGLPSRYFVPDFQLPKCEKSFCCFACCQKLYFFFSSIPWFPWRGPRINTDLDFMMMRLFRTDGGLGHVLKEVLILKEVKNLNDNDNRLYSVHNEEQREESYKTGDLIKNADSRDLRWKFDKNDGDPDIEVGVYDPDNRGVLPTITGNIKVFRIPNTVRGAVLGFSSYVQDRKLALCISFGSPSTGFATALARVYTQVVSLNFSPHYYNPEKTVELEETDRYYISLTCAEDVLSKKKTRDKLMTFINTARDTLPINFIFVSPIDKFIHISNVNYLINLLRVLKYLAPDVALLTMSPVSISEKQVTVMQVQDQTGNAEIDFYQYNPPKSFFPTLVSHMVEVVKKHTLIWPTFNTENTTESNETDYHSANDLPVCVVNTSTKLSIKTRMSFKLFSSTVVPSNTRTPPISGRSNTPSPKSGAMKPLVADQ